MLPWKNNHPLFRADLALWACICFLLILLVAWHSQQPHMPLAIHHFKHNGRVFVAPSLDTGAGTHHNTTA